MAPATSQQVGYCRDTVLPASNSAGGKLPVLLGTVGPCQKDSNSKGRHDSSNLSLRDVSNSAIRSVGITRHGRDRWSTSDGGCIDDEVVFGTNRNGDSPAPSCSNMHALEKGGGVRKLRPVEKREIRNISSAAIDGALRHAVSSRGRSVPATQHDTKKRHRLVNPLESGGVEDNRARPGSLDDSTACGSSRGDGTDDSSTSRYDVTEKCRAKTPRQSLDDSTVSGSSRSDESDESSTWRYDVSEKCRARTPRQSLDDSTASGSSRSDCVDDDSTSKYDISEKHRAKSPREVIEEENIRYDEHADKVLSMVADHLRHYAGTQVAKDESRTCEHDLAILDDNADKHLLVPQATPQATPLRYWNDQLKRNDAEAAKIRAAEEAAKEKARLAQFDVAYFREALGSLDSAAVPCDTGQSPEASLNLPMGRQGSSTRNFKPSVPSTAKPAHAPSEVRRRAVIRSQRT